VWAETLWNHDLLPHQWGVVIGVSLVAAVTDLRARRVPNLLTGPGVLAGLAWGLWVGGVAGLADSVAACLLLGLPYVLLFVFAGGGAGDAKLMGAIGAWLGVLNGVFALVSIAAVGVILSVAFALGKRKVGSVIGNMGRMLNALFMFVLRRRLSEAQGLLPDTATMEKVPYAVAVVIGVCIAAGGRLIWQS
jgi:prepilin peptidase CpaA